jgi:hypothetical protein
MHAMLLEQRSKTLRSLKEPPNSTFPVGRSEFEYPLLAVLKKIGLEI